MSSWDELTLLPPPSEARSRALWLQHAAGVIYFHNVRDYARSQIAPGLDFAARAAALKAIDDAVYGLMMVIDGVTGGLRGSGYAVGLETKVTLWRAPEIISETSTVDLDGCVVTEMVMSDEGGLPLLEIDLGQGDGMCMGYYGWCEGDYGEHPVVMGR